MICATNLRNADEHQEVRVMADLLKTRSSNRDLTGLNYFEKLLP